MTSTAFSEAGVNLDGHQSPDVHQESIGLDIDVLSETYNVIGVTSQKCHQSGINWVDIRC